MTQKREDSNKVYSIHEPEVLYITKGKEHKPYEFGNKSSFAYTRRGGINFGAMAIEGNAFYGHTLKPPTGPDKRINRWENKKSHR